MDRLAPSIRQRAATTLVYSHVVGEARKQRELRGEGEVG
jgi:hypothetical protein